MNLIIFGPPCGPPQDGLQSASPQERFTPERCTPEHFTQEQRFTAERFRMIASGGRDDVHMGMERGTGGVPLKNLRAQTCALVSVSVSVSVSDPFVI